MSQVHRAAIYARYSSDLQNPRSIDAQIRACRLLLSERFGLEACRVYSDAAISGTVLERPGMQALLDAVAQGKVDIIVAEGLDRLSRGLSDIARIFEVCKIFNVEIYTVHEQSVTHLHVGLKGTMNALFVEDLRQKVKRGQAQTIADGRIPSGNCYGYAVVKGVLDDRGAYVRGLRRIVEREAAVIRRCFDEFYQGRKPYEIARGLNRDGVPAPSGAAWTQNGLMGARSRASGILTNPLYKGWLVHGRSRKVVDPFTGKARHVFHQRLDWVWREIPHLRIVPEKLFDAVQAMRESGLHRNRTQSDPGRPKHN